MPHLLVSPAMAADKSPPIKNPPIDQTQINDILNSTVSSPANNALPPLPQDLKDMPVPELPPEIVDHNKNKTINLGPLHLGPLIQIASLRPIQLEADYNQPITLRDALLYTLRNSMPIRINEQTVASQKYNFYSALAGFLPNYSTNLTFTHSHIYPHTESNSRVYNDTFNAPVFQGGRVLYSALGSWYRYHGARNQFNASVNDTLLNTYNAYYNLLLQRALLQIRVKSVEVSQVQLRLNEQLYTAGTGTRFAVMQSRTQLALDRQALLQQQVAVRLSALQLCYTINMPLTINLVPVENAVTEASLVDEGFNIDDLLNTAIVHRPELRQYENLKLAAARNVQVAAAPLYPTAQWNITYQHSSTTISQPAKSPSPSAGTTRSTTTSTSSSSSTSSGTSTTGTTGGSTSTTTTTTSSGGGGAGASSGSTNIVGAGAFGGLFNTVSLSYNMNWTLQNLGVSSVANILSARAVARQALLQANQVLQQVSQQVRTSYLNMLTSREQIDVTATGVASSAEELRLANLRVQMGVGTNLELIQAQRDYIQALINQAQAIIASNQAQAQVLHDTGLISLDTLTTGFKKRIGSVGSTQ